MQNITSYYLLSKEIKKYEQIFQDPPPLEEHFLHKNTSVVIAQKISLFILPVPHPKRIFEPYRGY
jgi:hypothetical protein